MTQAVRESRPSDADDAVGLLDAAMLEFDRERVRRRVEAGSTLVAVTERHGADPTGSDPPGLSPSDRVVGVCVFDEVGADGRRSGATVIEQIAVHRSRRGRGIGTALVDAAAARSAGPVLARFREQVRPFYESLGFEIRPSDDGDARASAAETGDDTRLYGVLR
ncbi:GNAT family N-acetyltransferase [Halobellus sp. GM3]|uniref:GNAT family N-acetyltransferase n=1 Tax=Halobellus sp. GM3 TaxID=3458410 RepID=UPI00403D57A4